MKIGIFETTHFEGAYPVIKVFDNGKNEITIFTYEESYRQFEFLFGSEISRYKWIVKKSDESKYRFIRRIYTETRARQLELLYLNTIADNFIFYSWLISSLKHVRIVTTLHSINNYFQHKNNFTLRRVVRNIGKKRLIRVVKEFNVVALTMVDYLKSRLPPTKKVHCLPGAVYEGRLSDNKTLEQGHTLHVVVPGSVDERRRDYDLVLVLADKLHQAGLKVRITILGGIQPIFGDSVLRKLKECKSKSELKYYDVPVVDQPEFDRVMDDAHLVLLPSTIHNTITDDIQEVYGLTMSSGNLFDIIKHAKPFIAPRALKVDPFLDNSCLRYESVEEIVDILSALVDSPEFLSGLRAKAKIASEQYTVDAVRRRNKDLLG